MNPTDLRLPPALEAALHHIKTTTAAVAERLVLNLNTQASTATRIFERDLLLNASLDLRRKMSTFQLVFNDSLVEKVRKEIAPKDDPSRKLGATDWQSLSLVQDDEVEERMFSDRMGQQITHVCDAELRELATYMGAVLKLGHADEDRNPVRAANLGNAVYRAVEAVSEERDIRLLLTREFGQAMAQAMPACYRTILGELQNLGIQPVSLTIRAVDGPGHHLPGLNSGYSTLSRDSSLSTHGGVSGFHPSAQGLPAESRSGYGPGTTRRGAPPTTRSTHSERGSISGTGGPGGSRRGVAPSADAELMTLLRRLTHMASRPGMLDSQPGGPHFTPSMGYGAGEGGAAGDVGSLIGNLLNEGSAAGIGLPSANATGGGTSYSEGLTGLMAVNLIRAHREELMQASTGKLDHMVIDVVGSLFDQILSDPKVPPQMARQIARLQLPVLRVALSDSTFFSSRRHPVRRFVNRLGSLACAYEDFEEGPGKQFLVRVRELVQEIVEGDFDQLDLYTNKLAELESFISNQTDGASAVDRSAAALLEGKESELRVQQRYMLQLQSALSVVNMPAYLRDFLSQVWSQALVLATRRLGADSDFALRMRRAARDVVMSVQPKGSPALRKKFLMQLPSLMKDLNEGLKLIGWPEAAQKGFFGDLLPSHAESLKSPPLSELDHNLMVKQLDAIFGAPMPGFESSWRGEPLPTMPENEVERRFSPEEAKSVGLIEESTIDWTGEIDIDLSAESTPGQAPDAPETEPLDLDLDIDLGLGVDINLDLASPDPAEPSSGPQLIDHIKLGFAYQMHLRNEWQKVRLSFVSPGRTFFVFTHGRRHQETVSLTSRMLARMCQSGRMRAVESAYLMERATARARKQLAALKATGRR
jgi:hypothetical protein